MINIRRFAISTCIASFGLATYGYATEALDRQPNADVQDTVFYDMCIHSVPVEAAGEVESVDANSGYHATPAVDGHALWIPGPQRQER